MKQQFKKSPVTMSLIGLNVLIYLLMFLSAGWAMTSPPVLVQFGALYPPLLKLDMGQSYRLITAMFVHVGFQHLFSNMLTLYFLGQQIEGLYGSRRFFWIYFLAGVMGNLFCLAFSPTSLVAGASTAIYGLLALMVVLRWSPNPYLQQLGQSYMALLVMNLVFSFFPGISLAGHLGGAIGGACLALVIPLYPGGLILGCEGQRRAFLFYVGLVMFLLALGLF